MTDPNAIRPPASDDSQGVKGNMAGDKGHRYGNEYDSHRHEAPDTVRVGADDGGTAADAAGASRIAGEAIPREDGRRAHVDQRTGAVHGSGAGAGGGQPGEDFDDDAAGGSGSEGPAVTQ